MNVERAGLGRQDISAFEFADHQRANAERIARADQLVVGQHDQRIGALDLAQRLDEALDQLGLAAAGDEMENDLRVGRRLKDRALADEFAAQRLRIGQIAVVTDREAAGIQFGEQRLDVAQDRLAGRRVTHMADGRRARQALDRAFLGKVIADEAKTSLGMETGAVEGDDARRFLSAMLKRVQAESGAHRGVGVVENAEYAAIFAQAIIVGTGWRPRLFVVDLAVGRTLHRESPLVARLARALRLIWSWSPASRRKAAS